MAAISGSEFLLQLGTSGGTPTWTTFAGINSSSVTLNHEPIDVTNIASGGWKVMLDGIGMRSVSIKGSGFAFMGAEWDTVQTNFLAGTLTNFRILAGDDAEPEATITGLFRIASLELGGAMNEAVSMSLTLESSGAVTLA
jgi:TP901-1 family phage major tail protein